MTTPLPIQPSIFDAHHPPSQDLISDCVHCGFCLSTCPTYRLWGREADSPRGRIYLMDLGLEGQVPLDKAYVEHFDQCLGCMACLTSCPSGVQYDKLIEATRAHIERCYPRSAPEKLFRRLIYALFPHPARLRILSLPLWLYQRSHVANLFRNSTLFSLLPARLQAMHDLLPPVTLGSLLAPSIKPPPPSAPPLLRVGLLLGCVQQVYFEHVNRATARILAAEGCEVVIPRDQGCCGALMLHGGEEQAAIHLARRTIDAFEAAKVDVIAINAAGCGSAMKEFPHLLRDDPRYAARAKRFANKCRDISEILASLPPRFTRHPLPLRVAYHDACHLQHAQRITSQPREVLRTIPQLQILEIPDPAICCGSAGIYNLLEPTAAQDLGQRKAQNILETKPEAIVSGNPGCTLQIRASLKSLGSNLPVLHWVELLDASLSGTIPPGIELERSERP